MRKAILLFSISICCFLPSLIAQPPCGFDIVHKKLMQTDPEYARAVKSSDAFIREFINNHPQLKIPKSSARTMAPIVIPVVVHVMHTGGAVGTIYNPSDAQIQGAITYLNQVYAGTYPGMTPPSMGGAAGDMGIQFALAQRTPTCGATNGIDRVDASSIPNYTTYGVNSNNSTGVPDLTLKNFARWNPADYYNIWVVNKIDSADGTMGQFIAGYAYFAGAPASVDGTVMLATQMITGQKTLPHEIGHALNLYHPFQGSANDSQCPVNTDCTSDGDQVCDTDPVSLNFNVGTGLFNFSCRSGPNGCASPKNYSINTESNFMSYTNCYTLFTNEQAGRVVAAMSMSSRASLVAGSNMALVPCGTVINFSQASSTQTEDITGTLTGCRRYRDYTYQMTIGTGPSAAATATLTYSGTATKGLDYDVTTNGNFASPSNVLNFAAAATTAQSFTVRVYDDGEVEAPQTAIIDFTVNNGGGNAAKGTTTPTLTITVADNDVAPSGSSAITANVGSANTNLNQPFRGQFADARTQILYTKAELNAAGLTGAASITSIAFTVTSKVSTGPFNGFTVKMKNTTSTSYTGGVAFEGGATQVFTGAFTTVAGLNTITLTTPFIWNGTDNLLVDICYDNSTATGSGVGSDFVSGTAAVPQCQFDRVDGATGCSLANANVTFGGGGARPDVRIIASTIATSIETAATSTATSHIDVGSNDFFYSNNSKLLMRLGSISAPLGCVTSTLDAGGTTWVSYLGGQRSAKVFAVTPTTNTGTTTYTIALYFDNTELGGKAPGTLRIAKTTAASVAASNASNTISMTPTVTTLGTGTTVLTATFTGFSRFFLIDAGVTLPVNLVDFSGKLNNDQNTVLNWTTASEESNRQFDVEISSDAINFTVLGSVLSLGNSSTEKNYEYLHIKPPAGTSWYRLKQIDIDGHFKYSNIISVTVNKNIVKSFIYPVPSKDKITVNFGRLTRKISLELLTTDMKIVKRETVIGPALKKDMDIQDLSKGVYFIKLTSETGTELLRFVKE